MRPHEFLQFVENVDPEYRDELRQVLDPQGTGPVATSPHFVFVVCNLLRGLTPLEVSEQVEREKKTYLSVDAIREYSLQYVPPHLVQQSLMHRWLEKMDILDEVSILENLTKLQMMRVMARVDRPSIDADDAESQRRDIDALRKLACDTIDAKIKTGRMRSAPIKHEHEVIQSGEVTHNHTDVGKLDAQDAAAALQALAKIQALKEKDDVGSN